MKYRVFSAMVGIILILSAGMPAALLIAPPPKAEASLPVLDAYNLPENIISAIEETLTVAGQYADFALQVLYYVNMYVLEPMAFIQSGKAAQGITGGMLSFVSGRSNPSGQKQFATNLLGQLQGVGTNQALAFTSELQKNLDSPYAGVISASLRRNYLQDSSLQGLFSANRSTLGSFTNGNPTAFLAGNWSQGGVRAWLALTTQERNNPYMLYQNARAQQGSQSSKAQESQKEQLSWGKGFMSWCGATDSPPEEGDVCSADGYAGTMTDGICIQDEASDEPNLPVSPGSPCTNKDGTPGEIKTPGSTISGYLEKSLNLDAEKLSKLGNAATQITSLIGGIMQTVQLAQQVINGPQGGLAGVGDAGSTVLDSYINPAAGYAGVTQCDINAGVADTGPAATGEDSDFETRAAEYLAAWDTIEAAARNASSTVTRLMLACESAAAANPSLTTFVTRANMIAGQARYALARGATGANFYRPTHQHAILYVLNAAVSASTTVDDSRKLIAGFEDSLDDIDEATGDCLDPSQSVSSMATLEPSLQDVGDAQIDARVTGLASTTIPYIVDNVPSLDRLTARDQVSLKLVDTLGSLTDQMNLLTTNAQIILTAGLCSPP